MMVGHVHVEWTAEAACLSAFDLLAFTSSDALNKHARHHGVRVVQYPPREGGDKASLIMRECRHRRRLGMRR